jgi:predicted nuclease of restriction endonuclease-like RecB superfamily
MRFRCVCGRTINLSQKEAQRIIHDEQQFCSLACLYNTIVNTDWPKLDYPRNDSYLSTPHEVWDKVTKRHYRSFFEAYLARFFVDKGLDYQYEPHIIKVGTAQYTPDFYLPEYDLYFECKGLWLGSGRKKYLSAREQINIILLSSYLQKEFKKQYGLKNEIIS